MVDHWLVVVTEPQAIEDIRKAPDDVLSFDHALFRVRLTFFFLPLLISSIIVSPNRLYRGSPNTL